MKIIEFVRRPVVLGLSAVSAVGLFCVPFFLDTGNLNASVDGRGEFDPNDEDGDGMSDVWEVLHFGSIGARDGSEDDDLDDVSNLNEWLRGSDPLKLDVKSVGEVGKVDVRQADRDAWHAVRLDGFYEDPVVIVGPPTNRQMGWQQLVVRVRNVKSGSFEFQLQEQAYDHLLPNAKLKLSWMVVERGRHVLTGGQVVAAGTSDVAASGLRVDLDAGMPKGWPIVLSQISSANNTEVVVPRHWNVNQGGFNVKLQAPEGSAGVLVDEQLSWVMMDKGVNDGLSGRFEAGSTYAVVTEEWSSIDFSAGHVGYPAFLATVKTMNDADPVSIDRGGMTAAGAEVRLREDENADSEVAHGGEKVCWFASATGILDAKATTGDSDADGLDDVWELANGLTVGERDYYGDLDGDGLSNAEEYRYGSRADLADTDGDGASDFDEKHFYQSDALATDVGEFTQVSAVAGDAFSDSFGVWNQGDGHAVQGSARGWVEYPLSISSDGVYALEVEVGEFTGGNRSDQYEVLISVDGDFVSREKLEIAVDSTGVAKVLTPWLDAGAHTVRVFVDNSYTFRRAQVNEIRVLAAGGGDSNSNGIVDWAELRTDRQNGLLRDYSASKVSPVCLEGKARFRNAMTDNQGLVVNPGPNGTWFADLALDAIAPTDLVIDFENGGKSVSESIDWVPTNLLEESELMVRVDDSLRLTATNAPSGLATESVSLTVGGTTTVIPADQPMIHQFSTAGVQLIDVSYDDGAGNVETRQVTVKVVGRVTNLDSPVCVPGFERPWAVTGLPEEAIVQIDRDVAVFDGERVGTGGYSYTIAMLAPESEWAVVRLGYNGPILGNVEIRGMTLRSADKTSVMYAEDLGNGNYGLEMPVVVSEPHDGVTVRCDIFLAGVTFKEGGVTKDLITTDFDQFGSTVLEFVKLPNAHSNCHRFSVWHNGTRIAFYN